MIAFDILALVPIAIFISIIISGLFIMFVQLLLYPFNLLFIKYYDKAQPRSEREYKGEFK